MGIRSKLRLFFGLPKRNKIIINHSATVSPSSLQSTRDDDLSCGISSWSAGSLKAESAKAVPPAEDEPAITIKRAAYAIDVFHDGENCALHQSTDGSRLYDSVINSVLSAVERDPKNVDIDADCDVCWRFFLPMQGRGLFPSKALKDMLTRGVLHINPGDKKGAVDIVIKDCMERFLSEHFEDSLIKKERRIAVLISGDKDFASNVRRLRQSGLTTVIIYTPGKAAKSFLDQVPSKMSLGVWETLLQESRGHDTDKPSTMQRPLDNGRKKPVGISPPLKSRNARRRESRCLESVAVQPPCNIVENAVNFKHQCAMDLHTFLLAREGHSIKLTMMSHFWEIHPNHRNEIGRISAFCQSPKSEGVFQFQKINGEFVLMIRNSYLANRADSDCIKSEVEDLPDKRSTVKVAVEGRKEIEGEERRISSSSRLDVSQDNREVVVHTSREYKSSPNLLSRRCYGKSLLHDARVMSLLLTATSYALYIIMSVYVSCILLGIRVPI